MASCALLELRVPRAQFSDVAEALSHGESLRILHLDFVEHSSAEKSLRRMNEYLSRQQNPKWKDSTSRVIVIRPLVAPVSDPIQATTDDGALFELLAQVGGRMPQA